MTPRLLLSSVKTGLYRRPKDEVRRMLTWGARAYFRCNAWAREMEREAWILEKPEAIARQPGLENASLEYENHIEVWFLTGRRFWYQTAFCAWTLAKHSRRNLILNLVDDGSLEPCHEEGLRRLFPEGVTIRKESIREKIDQLLPHESFPMLRKRWGDYVNIRKLTDVHLGARGVKLVLDSDMLFFRRPDALLKWWDGTRIDANTSKADDSSIEFSPCLMTDCIESYGYSRALMEDLAGAPIPPLLNVGICGLRSEDVDWEKIEHWCQILFAKEGGNYFLEQALVAMLAAGHSPTVMCREDYITFPSREQADIGKGVLQHFVSDSKPYYFGKAWKMALSANEN